MKTRSVLASPRRVSWDKGRTKNLLKTPIILAAHSMGGLIAKEVCCRDECMARWKLTFVAGIQYGLNSRKRAWRYSFQNQGHCFLCNTSSGSLQCCSTQECSTNKSAHSSASEYISDLEPDSTLIDHINETFRNNSKDLELVSFYETHSTPIGPLHKVGLCRK